MKEKKIRIKVFSIIKRKFKRKESGCKVKENITQIVFSFLYPEKMRELMLCGVTIGWDYDRKVKRACKKVFFPLNFIFN